MSREKQVLLQASVRSLVRETALFSHSQSPDSLDTSLGVGWVMGSVNKT